MEAAECAARLADRALITGCKAAAKLLGDGQEAQVAGGRGQLECVRVEERAARECALRRREIVHLAYEVVQGGGVVGLSINSLGGDPSAAVHACYEFLEIRPEDTTASMA